MAEPIKLEWDQAKAVELVNSFRSKWTQKEEAGITGKPDAGTNKPNSPSVYQWLLSHGKSEMSRKKVLTTAASKRHRAKTKKNKILPTSRTRTTKV